MFTAVYMVFGDRDNDMWNAFYFMSNYLIIILLSLESKDSTVRLIGVSLSLAILLFVVLKFFISLEAEKLRYYNAATFILIFAGLYKLDKK